MKWEFQHKIVIKNRGENNMKQYRIILIILALCIRLQGSESGEDSFPDRKTTADIVSELINNDECMKELSKGYENDNKLKQEMIKRLLTRINKMQGNWKELTPEKYKIPKVEVQDKEKTDLGFGYQCNLPWKISKISKEKDKSVKYYFPEKRFLMLTNPAHNYFDEIIMRKPLYAAFINRFISEKNRISQYRFWQKCLNSKASDISLDSKEKTEEIWEKNIFLILKKIAVGNSSRIYQISVEDNQKSETKTIHSNKNMGKLKTTGIKGFQFGEPGKDRWIYFYLFDEDNKLIELYLESPDNCKNITQQNLNSILQSFCKTKK